MHFIVIGISLHYIVRIEFTPVVEISVNRGHRFSHSRLLTKDQLRSMPVLVTTYIVSKKSTLNRPGNCLTTSLVFFPKQNYFITLAY